LHISGPYPNACPGDVPGDAAPAYRNAALHSSGSGSLCPAFESAPYIHINPQVDMFLRLNEARKTDDDISRAFVLDIIRNNNPITLCESIANKQKEKWPSPRSPHDSWSFLRYYFLSSGTYQSELNLKYL
jgi:hypothetical protein